MTELEIINKLTEYNKWRRGDDEIEHPDPKELGVVIDEAIKMIKKRIDTKVEIKRLRNIALSMENFHNRKGFSTEV